MGKRHNIMFGVAFKSIITREGKNAFAAEKDQ